MCILMVNVLKLRTLFSFCSRIKWGVVRAAVHKMLVRIANREYPDKTASEQSGLCLHCLAGNFLNIILLGTILIYE